jgi:hypothetical protein
MTSPSPFSGASTTPLAINTIVPATRYRWGIAAMVHALVSSINSFMFARVFLGVSEAGNFPAALLPPKDETGLQCLSWR